MTTEVEVYGYVCGTSSCGGGYGHVTAQINGLLRGSYAARSVTISIRCQSGGHNQRETYAWKWGVTQNDEILPVDALEETVKLVRKISKNLDRLAADLGWPRSFAEYATRIMRAANLETVFVNPTFDGRVSFCTGGVMGFPQFNARRSPDDLEKAISLIEAAAIARFQ